MKTPSEHSIQNMVSVYESWRKELDGRVMVRKWIEHKDGHKEFWGEEETAYSDVPFYKLGNPVEAQK